MTRNRSHYAFNEKPCNVNYREYKYISNIN